MNCELRAPFYQFLYIIQFAQRLERREVVDVETKYLVAYLTKYRVVELEEVQLNATVCILACLYLPSQVFVVYRTFQFLENNICSCHNSPRHTSQLGNMDTETMFRTASFQFTQEDDLTIDLLDADVEILDAREGPFHLVQLVIVCGKERAGMSAIVLMDVFDNGPRDGNAVVGTCAATQFIEEH